jgi:hypothetical protein
MSAQAATPSVMLAKSLKTTMARSYKSKGSDDVFTKVTCVVKPGATVGHCKAYFTSASLHQQGWFDVTAGIKGGAGAWQATKVTCLTKSGAPTAC